MVQGTSIPGEGWTNHTMRPSPPAIAGGAMAYSSRDGIFVLFGGETAEETLLGSAWTFDPRADAWREVHSTPNPTPRGDPMFVYDEQDDVFILFGGWFETSGEAYHRLGDTWAFYLKNQSWVRRNPSVSPSPRSDSLVAYDPIDGITLLVGGYDGSTFLGDTWQYTFKGDSWTPLRFAVSPSPRADGRMVYDTKQRLFLVFGGNDFSGPNYTFNHLGDTWSYDWGRNLWTQIPTESAPSPRDYPIFAYDSVHGELLLVGGYGNRIFLGDVWTFNSTRRTWSNITIPGGPAPRFAAVGGFDSQEGVLVLFGGGNRDGAKSDTWFFRYPPPLLGRLLASSGNPIIGQEVSFQAVLQGGSGLLSRLGWWFGDGGLAEGPSASHAFSLPGVFQVRFEAEDNSGHLLTIMLDVPVGVLVPFWADFIVLGLGLGTSIGIARFGPRFIRRWSRKAPRESPSPERESASPVADDKRK